MGMCGSLAKKKKITVIQGNSKSIQTNESNIIEQSKPNYLYLTAESNWTLVIDFMKYKELKELSKVNR